MAGTSFGGQCFCGSIRYEIAGPSKYQCFCHCDSCRRAAGAPYVAWATFVRDKFHIVRGQLSEHRSSQHALRGSCGNCGTSLTYCHDRRSDDIDVTLVTLDDPSVLVPKSHIWVEDKLPYVNIQDGLPQFDTVPGK